MSAIHHRFAPLLALSLTAPVLCPSLALAAGYRQDEVRNFQARPDQKADFLVGFDPRTQRTKQTCVRTKKKLQLKELAGSPATARFEYAQTLQEVFAREELDLEVSLRVNYIVSAEVDVNLKEMSEHSRRSNLGLVYWSYRNLHDVKWVMNEEFELTPDAKALHDKAVVTGKWKPFYDKCGRTAIINKRHEDFYVGTLTFEIAESSSASEKKTAVDAMIGFANIARASASVDKARKSYDKIRSEKREVDAFWSGEPKGMQNVDDIETALETYRKFPSMKNNTEYTGFGVVPYSELVPGFGDLPGMEELGKKRRNKIQTIADGLDFEKRAIMKLKMRKHEHVPQALVYLEQDYQRARKAFVDEKACLEGEWSPTCEDLRAKYASWPTAGGGSIDRFLDTMLSQSQTCPATGTQKTVIVNPKGHITCLVCDFGETAVFADGKNGKCGRVTPAKAAGSVRLGLDDLDDPKQVSGGEAGVKVTDYRRPDVCRKPGQDCKKPRADQICKERGFADSTFFDVIASSKTRWANGDECVQSKENTKPVPQKCRTFATLDCACPAGKKPKGKTCE